MHHSVLALHGRQSTSIATCAAGIAYLLLGPYSGFGCNGLQEEGVCEVDPSRLITTATKIMHSDLAPREVNLLTGLVVRVFFSLSTTFPYQRLLVRQITPVKWLCVGEVFRCSKVLATFRLQHLSLASIAVSTTLTKGEQLHKSLLLV